MSKIITSDNGVEISVGLLALEVTDPVSAIGIYVRLSQEQRRDLADALVPVRDFSGVDWRSMYDQARSERDAAVYAYDKADRERDEALARAEAAEARTAPAVTKADIEKAVRGQWGGCFDGLTDAVWSLVSGADPAVFVVRESDLPEVWRDNKHNLMGEFCRHWWSSDGDWTAHQDSDAREVRTLIPSYLRKIAGWEATARAIEAEAGQATDPLLAKARELWDVAHPPTPGVGGTWRAVWEQATEAERDRYLLLARHALGQEADQ